MRRASQASFPYGWPGRVCYIAFTGYSLAQLHGRDEMRQAVRSALDGNCEIYAAWPGQYRTDLFLVDDIAALAQAIGLPVPAEPAK